jgi:hypothetical protein
MSNSGEKKQKPQSPIRTIPKGYPKALAAASQLMPSMMENNIEDG